VSLSFQLDEHITDAIAHGLRRRGISVVTAFEAGLCGQPDVTVLMAAQRSGRVFVTHDQDFLRFQASGVSHAGIAFCRFGTRSVGEIVIALARLSEFLDAADMRDSVEFL
jgi:predicted nuclease of predicted toxin-antitoxin system